MTDMTHNNEALETATPVESPAEVEISQPQDHYAFLADIKVRL